MNAVTAKGPTRAMILAAGKGLRMRPITDTTPKPMVQLNGRPLIEHALDRLEAVGVTEVVVNTHHLAEQIEAHLKKHKGARIRFSPEAELLETGGGVKQALPLLGEDPFFVVNGDAFWLNGPANALQRMIGEWDPEKMDALLMLHSTVVAYGYDGHGDFQCDADGKLVRRTEGELAPWLFAGVQILDPAILKGAPDGAFSLNWAYDRSLEAERLYGMVHDGEWFHVGTPEGLEEAERYLQVRFPESRHR